MMNTGVIMYLIIGTVFGIFIGIVLVNFFSPRVRKYNQVKHDLEETKKELANQKQVIVKHFSHSAEILDNMAKDFRRLYQHMAENSSHLLSEQEIKESLSSAPTLRVDEEPEQLDSPPKDYSGNPSGLLKTEEKNSID